jgi:hypothetical protein
MADLTSNSSRPDVPSSVTALLERTTPERVAPPDLNDLAHRGRRRRRRQRATLAASVVTVVALFVAVFVALEPDRKAGDDLDTAQPGPNGEPLAEPVGSWRQVADAPFSPRTDAFTGTLSDGRVLVWGGSTMGDIPDETARPLDGGIYDPESGEWTPIPAAPLPETAESDGSGGAQAILLVDDRLAVVTSGPTFDTSAFEQDQRVRAAVYDVAEQRWYESPPQDDIIERYDAAWDGETLALVRIDPYGSDAPADARIDQPVTLRWRPGDDAWHEGTPPPLSLRSYTGRAFNGQRLAIWGGTTTQPTDLGDYPDFPNGRDPGAMNDGAIYDVASDSWQAIPAAPMTGRIYPNVVWSNSRLLVAGGAERPPEGDTPVPLADMTAYDPVTGTWQALPAAPGPIDGTQFSVFEFDAGNPPFVVSTAMPGADSWFLVDDHWEQPPLGELYRLGDLIIATSGSGGTPAGTSIGVQVRVGPDEWLDAAEPVTTEAALGNREGAIVGATGTQLVIIGGWDGSGLREDTWVFDPAG